MDRAALGRSGLSRRLPLVQHAALLAGPHPRAAGADLAHGGGAAASGLAGTLSPAVVFLNVLLARLGVPIPAMPTMIVGGAEAAEGKYSLALVFAVAVLASLIGDAVWYALGRAYGMRVLRLLCSISLSADS